MEIAVKGLPKSDLWGVIVLILVLTGTNPYGFERMVKAADQYAGEANEDMFIQLGNTDYKPVNASYERFLSRQELLKKIHQSDIIISQGGFGSIAECLMANKNVIAIPRKPELGESPDVKEELVRKLEEQGRLSAVYNIEDLPSVIECSKNKKYRNIHKNKIPKMVKIFIEINSLWEKIKNN
jgi:UDP-N-acetylglucosamine transferase subunit ALG13